VGVEPEETYLSFGLRRARPEGYRRGWKWASLHGRLKRVNTIGSRLNHDYKYFIHFPK
jgi:hypothetical protein